MEFNGDPTGFISHCMSELIKVGFDASAISLAKWVGVALLVAIFLAAAVTFYSRLRHGKDILPVLSDTHFKMILAAGLLLVVLPMIAKISGDAFDVSLASADRDFAQRICQDSLDVTAATAQAEAVKARLDVLEGKNDHGGSDPYPVHKPRRGTHLRSRNPSVRNRVDRQRNPWPNPASGHGNSTPSFLNQSAIRGQKTAQFLTFLMRSRKIWKLLLNFTTIKL